MATSDETEEVYLNLRHVTPWFKKKAMPTQTKLKEMDEMQSQHNQGYGGFPGEDNNSSQNDERAKSVHDYMSVKDLIRNTGKSSKPDARSSETPSVIYERFSEILPQDKNNKSEETKLQTINRQINNFFRNALLISGVVILVCVLLSVCAAFVVESFISKKLEEEKTEEKSRTERLKTNAEWSDWASWGRCSVSCDLGLSSRDRKCLAQNTTVIGEYCIGLSHEEKICKETACADGGWGYWGPWGPCSLSCGVGTRTRARQCDNPTPSVLGKYCEGPPVETDVCLPQACTDGDWSDWSSWETCSATCNGGLQSRTRNCSDPAPSELGKTCIGNDVESRECNTDKCKGPMVYFNAYFPLSRTSSLVTVSFQRHVGNSSFNSSTGIFTCPVPGLYYFTVNFKGRYGAYCFLRCVTNGTDSDRSYTYAKGYSSSYYSASGAAYCQLDIGDQAYLSCGAMNYLSNIQNIAFFTGALISPA